MLAIDDNNIKTAVSKIGYIPTCTYRLERKKQVKGLLKRRYTNYLKKIVSENRLRTYKVLSLLIF